MEENWVSGKVEVKVLLFAKAKELVEKSEEVVTLTSALTGREILEEIIRIFPSLSPLSSCLMLALNQTYIELDDHIHLKNSDEIAVIPPLSGG